VRETHDRMVERICSLVCWAQQCRERARNSTRKSSHDNLHQWMDPCTLTRCKGMAGKTRSSRGAVVDLPADAVHSAFGSDAIAYAGLLGRSGTSIAAGWSSNCAKRPASSSRRRFRRTRQHRCSPGVARALLPPAAIHATISPQ
jgi:hypothetical protein